MKKIVPSTIQIFKDYMKYVVTFRYGTFYTRSLVRQIFNFISAGNKYPFEKVLKESIYKNIIKIMNIFDYRILVILELDAIEACDDPIKAKELPILYTLESQIRLAYGKGRDLQYFYDRYISQIENDLNKINHSLDEKLFFRRIVVKISFEKRA